MEQLQNYHFYINLRDDINKNGDTIKELIKFGIKNPRRFNAIKHEIGAVGCTYSQIGCIEYAKKCKWPFVCIFEDDIIFRKKEECKEMINKYINYDYDVLYLGTWVLDNKYKFINKDLIQVNKTWCTHAYIIKSHYYDTILENLYEGVKLRIESDNVIYACDNHYHILQKKDKWYCLYNNYVSQKDGYSSTHNKYINYTEQIFYIPIHYDFLPNVSILTPTGNRDKFLPLMINNIKGFKYPKEKLEWNILDSNDKKLITYQKLFKSKDEIDELEKKLGVKINYKYMEGSLTIGTKRNLLAENSNTDFLINMDDDDIYREDYIDNCIDLLIRHNKNMTGSNDLLIIYPKRNYRIIHLKCMKSHNRFHEGTICYKKSHWLKNKFKETSMGEGLGFGGDDGSVCIENNIYNCGLLLSHDNNTIDKEQFACLETVDYSKIETIGLNKALNILKSIYEKDKDNNLNMVKIEKDLLIKIRNIIDISTQRIHWKIDELYPVGKVINEIDKLIK